MQSSMLTHITHMRAACLSQLSVYRAILHFLWPLSILKEEIFQNFIQGELLYSIRMGNIINSIHFERHHNKTFYPCFKCIAIKFMQLIKVYTNFYIGTIQNFFL